MTWSRSPRFVLPALLPTALAAACVDNAPASDVRGNYSLTFDDRLTLKLNVGGVDHEATAREGETVSFEVNGEPITLDLGAFCAREDVQCPSETLWTEVSIDQPQIAAENPNTHVINVINNTERDLPPGQQAAVVSGLVDENDRFWLILGAGSGGEGDCGLLALSTAEGRFTHEGEREEPCPTREEDDAGSPDAGDADAGDENEGEDEGEDELDGGPEAPACKRLVWDPGAPVNGIAEGRVKLGYLGVCAFGPALLGATLEISTGFTGVRTGAFDPPPFSPVDPAEVEAAQSDAGPEPVDGGPEE